MDAARTRRGALVAAVRDHPPDEPVPALAGYVGRHGADRIGALAARHGVTGCLWTAMRASGLGGVPGAETVRMRHATAVANHLRTLTDLDLVDSRLRAAGIRHLVLKGPVLAEAVYRRPDLREYVDLDLLVAPADFAAAIAALEAGGCTLYERNWRLMHRRLIGEVRLFTPAGTVVDLHWHLVSEVEPRTALEVDMAGIWARARQVDVRGRPVLTLDPVDTLLHVGVHACLSGGNRLVWLKDVEQAARRLAGADWEAVLDRARRWRAGPALAVILTRARSVLGAPVPADLPRRLAPDWRWRAITRVADALAPAGQPRVDASVSRLVARSSRGDPSASRRELLRRSATRVRHPVARPQRLFDPDNPDSAAYASGGLAGRVAYLDEVTRQPG
jgi:Uncharacterised nucleotidyltransferase